PGTIRAEPGFRPLSTIRAEPGFRSPGDASPFRSDRPPSPEAERYIGRREGDMDRPPGYFTLEEATRVLPLVRSLLEALRDETAELSALQRRLREGGRALESRSGRRDRPPAGTNGHGPEGAAGKFLTDLQRADALLESIR